MDSGKFSSTTNYLLVAFNYSNKFQRNASFLCIISPHKFSSIFLSRKHLKFSLYISKVTILLFDISHVLPFQIVFMPNFTELVFSYISIKCFQISLLFLLVNMTQKYKSSLKIIIYHPLYFYFSQTMFYRGRGKVLWSSSSGNSGLKN